MIDSVEEFIRLRTSEIKSEYDRVAHEEAPIEVWWELVRNYPEMKTWVVGNKTVPTQILEAMSLDEDPAVRSAVARKRKATRQILERLALDSDSGVRFAVVCNRRAPADVLRILTNDDWDTVSEEAKARLNEIS